MIFLKNWPIIFTPVAPELFEKKKKKNKFSVSSMEINILLLAPV